MQVKILKTDWFLGQDPNEGTVTFQTESGDILDAFSYGENIVEGEIVDADIYPLVINFDWDTAFTLNANKEQELVKTDKWSYCGYGKILGIDPVMIDFGSLIFDSGSWTNDRRVIGEYVCMRIDRLDISLIN